MQELAGKPTTLRWPAGAGGDSQVFAYGVSLPLRVCQRVEKSCPHWYAWLL